MLTQRKGAVLRFLVSEYIDTATAVGSETLVRRHGLGWSPATVRSEMAALEEEGFIARAHPSAGGVPLEKGYRYYMETEPPRDILSPEAKRSIQRRLGQVERDVETWVDEATEGLAEMAANIAIATSPRGPESRLRHLELVHLQGYFVLLVVILQEAMLRKELIPLQEPMDQDELTVVANKLNATFSGRSRAEILDSPLEVSPFEARVRERTLHMLQREDEERYSDYYVYGLRHLLRQPEFSTGANTQAAVEVLEDRALLQAVFSQLPETGEVGVIIGRENPHDALHPFSVVICRYGLSGDATGTVGVIGPTRMEYHRTIAAVQYISSLVSQLLADTYEA